MITIIFATMKKNDTSKDRIVTVRDEEVVIDSDDVRRAEELAIKRGRAIVEEEVTAGQKANLEILTDKDHRKL